MKVMVVCCYCGEIFERDDNKIKNRNFCSVQCMRNFNSKEMSIYNKRENPMNKKGCPMTMRIKKRKRMIDYLKQNVGDKKSKQYEKILGNFKHRLLAEIKIGRKLEDDEVVHHIDGNHLNNDIENLQVMKRSEHMSLHIREYWNKRKVACGQE